MNNQFGFGGMPMNNMQMPMNMMGGMAMGGMPMNMMGGMGVNNQMMNDDEDWLQGFKMGVDEINMVGDSGDQNNSGPKFNVLFTTTIGTKRMMVLNYGTTVDQALRKYLEHMGKESLINSDKISFLYNAAKLNFGDQTPIEKFFKNISNPKIVVNDVNNLIDRVLNMIR